MNEPRILSVGITNVRFGKSVTVMEPSNLYGCEIGDNTFIGPFVEIQSGAKIGKNCKIQSHAFVCERVTIGNDCFVSHGAMFINDLFSDGTPAGGDRTKWKCTELEDNVCIGTNATILPVRICANVVVGAGAVVTSDILRPGKYVGNPARRIDSK